MAFSDSMGVLAIYEVASGTHHNGRGSIYNFLVFEDVGLKHVRF